MGGFEFIAANSIRADKIGITELTNRSCPVCFAPCP
jgi:hypothetical protein